MNCKIIGKNKIEIFIHMRVILSSKLGTSVEKGFIETKEFRP